VAARTPRPSPAPQTAPPPPAASADRALVEVAGRPIRVSDLELAPLFLGASAAALPKDKVRAIVLAHLVDQRLAADAAVAEGAKPEIARMASEAVADKVAPPAPDETPAARARRLGYLETSALADAYFRRRESSLAPDDAALRRRYDELAAAREIRFSYIVADSRESVEQARRRVSLGEPFDAVARQASADPDTAPKGGDLGWLLEPALQPPFSDLARSLEPGRMSGLFRTDMGWNVALLVDRRPARLPPFEQVKDRLRKQAVEAMRAETVAALRAAATIVWNVARPEGF
jgi:peptidyl-prolyl cis-trans isomerase C